MDYINTKSRMDEEEKLATVVSMDTAVIQITWTLTPSSTLLFVPHHQQQQHRQHSSTKHPHDAWMQHWRALFLAMCGCIVSMGYKILPEEAGVRNALKQWDQLTNNNSTTCITKSSFTLVICKSIPTNPSSARALINHHLIAFPDILTFVLIDDNCQSCVMLSCRLTIAR